MGDISRISHNSEKRYNSVRMQQGRVLLDSDWNENQQIQTEYTSDALADIIGKQGAPANGFRISFDQNTFRKNISNSPLDFYIQAGTLYLDGRKVTLDSAETLRNQSNDLSAGQPPLPSGQRHDLAYLEVIETEVTSIEDGELVEKALGGPDTTTRTRLLPRVRLLEVTPGSDLNFREQLKASLNLNTPARRLRLEFTGETTSPDLCSRYVQSGYLGPENQAIRVQLTDSSHFTWGFDNGSALYRITLQSSNTIELISQPRDEASRLKVGQTVEILTFAADLPNGEKTAESNGILTRISSINADGSFVLEDAVTVPNQTHYYLRVWDRGADLTSPAEIQIVNGGVVLGETGVRAFFSSGKSIPGDSWTFAVRPDTSEEIHPRSLLTPNGDAPHGAWKSYMPLALIRWQRASGSNVDGKIIEDFRNHFPALTAITADDVSYDGSASDTPAMREAETVQEAIDLLDSRDNRIESELDELTERVNKLHPGCCTIYIKPDDNVLSKLSNLPEGSNIHVYFSPGNYIISKPVVLKKLGDIKLFGAGPCSKIICNTNNESVFRFEECGFITLNDLYAETRRPSNSADKAKRNGVLTLINCFGADMEKLTLVNAAATFESSTCITVRNAPEYVRKNPDIGSVRIRCCNLHVGHFQSGILLINVDRATVEDNCLRVRKKPKTWTFRKQLDNKVYRAKMRNLFFASPKPETIEGEGYVNISYNDMTASFKTNSILENDWQNILDANPPKKSADNNRSLMLHAKKLADKILLEGQIGGAVQAARLVDMMKQKSPAFASKAIVVAGEFANDIRIINNSVTGFLQGIHTGLSKKNARNSFLMIARLEIANNTLNLTIPPGELQRFGIFVGNCTRLIITNNLINAYRAWQDSNSVLEGIRLFGMMGRFISITQNELRNVSTSIYFNPINTDISKPVIWAIKENLGSGPEKDENIRFGPYIRSTESASERTKRHTKTKEIQERTKISGNIC